MTFALQELTSGCCYTKSQADAFWKSLALPFNFGVPQGVICGGSNSEKPCSMLQELSYQQPAAQAMLIVL